MGLKPGHSIQGTVTMILFNHYCLLEQQFSTIRIYIGLERERNENQEHHNSTKEQ